MQKCEDCGMRLEYGTCSHPFCDRKGGSTIPLDDTWEVKDTPEKVSLYEIIMYAFGGSILAGVLMWVMSLLFL